MKAAVFFADGFEEIEGLTPVDYLRRAGIEVTTVGVTGKKYEDTMIVNGAHNIQIIVDTTLDKYIANNDLPDCLVCPGGALGADNLAASNELKKFLETAWDNNKLVTANCASPAIVLGKTKILKNKKWTCYPGMADNANAEYLAGYSNQVFITDGNLVTARGPGASEEFSMELVRLLAGDETYNKIRKGSQQR